MRERLEKIGNVSETRTLKVVTKGDGLALYLTKDLCEVCEIWAGDRVKAKLMDHFRPETREKEESSA